MEVLTWISVYVIAGENEMVGKQISFYPDGIEGREVESNDYLRQSRIRLLSEK